MVKHSDILAYFAFREERGISKRWGYKWLYGKEPEYCKW